MVYNYFKASGPIKEFIETDVFLGNEPRPNHAGVPHRHFLPAFGALLGCTAALFANIGQRRPPWSGLQMYALFIAIGGSVGEGWFHLKEWKNARRDAMLKHYIELHPEHFVNDERPKYKDVFEPWYPMR
uniref:NADH dehydrogenase [ubiquinone] 1 subunit C2 n=1 Tax=Strigamia maritima TaxID=126957 RepID=T1JKB1_STRMM